MKEFFKAIGIALVFTLMFMALSSSILLSSLAFIEVIQYLIGV